MGVRVMSKTGVRTRLAVGVKIVVAVVMTRTGVVVVAVVRVLVVVVVGGEDSGGESGDKAPLSFLMQWCDVAVVAMAEVVVMVVVIKIYILKGKVEKVM